MAWHNFGNTFYFGFDSFFNTPWRRASQVALVVKNLPASAGDARDMSLIPGPEDPLVKGMATHSKFLPGKFLRQKSLVGYSPRDRKELDTTEYQCSPTNHTP